MWKKHIFDYDRIIFNIFEYYIEFHEMSDRTNNFVISDFDRHVYAYSISIISDVEISSKAYFAKSLVQFMSFGMSNLQILFWSSRFK